MFAVFNHNLFVFEMMRKELGERTNDEYVFDIVLI